MGNKQAGKNYYYDDVAKSYTTLEGKRIAITGTTSGTGFAAADTIAGLGGELVLFNRKSTRADSALARLKEKHPKAVITPIDCDLMSFSSVRQAAETYLSKFGGEGLDVLANNAGIMAFDNLVTEDGFDVQIQTNHLSHYLLTHLLFPELEIAANRTGEARIVNHSSLARWLFPISIDRVYFQKNTDNSKLGGNWSYPRYKRYQQSKLANAVYSAALFDKIVAKNSNVKVVTAHPGMADTELVSNTSSQDGLTGYGMKIMDSIVTLKQSSYDGALPLLACIMSKEVSNGDFWGPNGDATCGKPSKFQVESRCNNETAKRILIEESDAATGIEFSKL